MPLKLSLVALAVLQSAAIVPSTPDLGQAAGRCRPDETGPAFIVNVAGLRDQVGRLKLEVYPANDDDFLEDDNILISAGKTFRRVEVPVPRTENPELCIRVPRPGRYSLALLHDRNSDRRFNWRRDGIGFAGNPRLGFSQPDAEEAVAVAGSGRTKITIVLNYLRGLRLRPLEGD
ncbi:DUF2141 domain-containing protein [Stakelama pacifica]|uniref:Uncharacterized protein (DUF2141 family) n=1 Tax=Stakelama pacifica TaxID=517720 RepID=A0A4R6FD14_9SPHN|nr:DUF2141 domain-containing protein [Stakelama pacifica]TDN78967.1 uncharacterized protein (DUF2141 family) [Stakelama pacifica]GGO98990.1 hypothetical protein GCM10011329_31470 [Stakelama pacifica]